MLCGTEYLYPIITVLFIISLLSNIYFNTKDKTGKLYVKTMFYLNSLLFLLGAIVTAIYTYSLNENIKFKCYNFFSLSDDKVLYGYAVIGVIIMLLSIISLSLLSVYTKKFWPKLDLSHRIFIIFMFIMNLIILFIGRHIIGGGVIDKNNNETTSNETYRTYLSTT